MDPNEAQNVMQYMQLFGHAPQGTTPQNLQLIQALQQAKQAQGAQPGQNPLPGARQPIQLQTTGVPTYSSATPGVSGAIKDVVHAVAKAAAPKSITQRQSAIDKAVSQ